MEHVLAEEDRFDLAVFFEMMNNHPSLLGARKKVFVPNPEYLEPEYEPLASHCDVFWHKTRFSHGQLKEIFPASRHEIIGFTSFDPGVSVRNHQRFLHVKGARATRRNTESLVRCWKANSSFPTLSILSHLPIEQDLSGVKNIVTKEGWLSRHGYIQLIAEYGIHVCTSECEGFGHYINEARAMGALVVTTDAPPMNELVCSDSGILIKSEPAGRANRGLQFRLEQDDLMDSIRRVIGLSEDERSRLGRTAKHRFRQESRLFYAILGREFKRLLQAP